MVDDANRIAEQMRTERRQQADDEYERIISRARADIDAQVRQATEALRHQVGDLAVSVVEKVLGDGLDAEVAPHRHRPHHRRGGGPSRRRGGEHLTCGRASAATPTPSSSRRRPGPTCPERQANWPGCSRLVDSSQDLRRALTDPGVPVPARRGVISDLLEARVGPATVRLINYAIEADRATEFRDDLAWLVARIDAAARDLEPVGDVVLGRAAAAERLDGYATGRLERSKTRRPSTTIEDELFRFMRIVNGSPDLQAVLDNRDVTAPARRALVVDLLQSRATATTVLLAAYATQIGRPRDYETLLAHLVDRVAAESNRRLADVRAPVELDDDQRQHLAVALGRIVGPERRGPRDHRPDRARWVRGDHWRHRGGRQRPASPRTAQRTPRHARGRDHQGDPS